MQAITELLKTVFLISFIYISMNKKISRLFCKMKLLKPVYLITTILFILFGVLNAQDNKNIFDRIMIDDGLSQSSVYSICQDKKGFLWIGTEDGLNKYDGYSFSIYRTDPENPFSLSNNFIKAITEDQAGVLWIGTYGGGLNKFDRDNDNFISYQKTMKDSNCIGSNHINSLCVDRNGNLWIGTDNGLDKFNPSENKFIHFKYDPDESNSLSNNKVLSVIEDKEGALWIGTDGGGLNKFDPESNRFDCYKSSSKIKNSISNNHIHAIYQDKYGILWIGTQSGLNKFDLKTQKIVQYKTDLNNPFGLKNDFINAMYEDQSGILWIGTDNSGVYKFQREKERFICYNNDLSDPASLSNNQIYSIFEDRSQVLWVGTNVGLNKFNQVRKRFISYQNKLGDIYSLSDNYVRAFCEDNQGDIWIGTFGGGLNKYLPDKEYFIRMKQNPNNSNSIASDYIYSIIQDKKGIFWIGTENGINKYDPIKNKFTHIQSVPGDLKSLSNNTVRIIFEDKSGLFWFGTAEGLNRYNPKTDIFTQFKNNPENPFSVSNNFIYAICEDRFSDIWIGTLNGLNKFDRKKGHFIQYFASADDQTSLSNSEILSIYEDKSGTLWLGTPSGLNKFNRDTKSFTYYSERDGLPNDLIYSILEDEKGNLWLSTNKGLSKFNLKTEKFKNYDVKDGLQSNEFNLGASCKTRNGEMYFGGINGFNKYFPSEIKDNPFIPPIVITDFKLFYETVPVGKSSPLKKYISETEEIILSYKQNVFSFEFVALHFSVPENNEYAYMMEGIDEDWIKSGDRRYVPYNSLPSGEYVFRVKGTNSDGVWNENGTAIKITITPPFWSAMWFRGLIIIIVIIIVILFYKARTRSIREISRKLEERVKERTIELQEEIKERKKLEQESNHRAAQASLLNKIGQKVSSHLKLDELLNEIVTSLCETFNYYGVMLLMMDGQGEKLKLQSISGGYSDVFPSDLTIATGEGLIGRAALTKEKQISGDVTKNPYYVIKANEVTKSELSIPIICDSIVIAVLDIQSDKINAFDESDVAIIQTFSSQISSAINNARLYDQAKKEISDRKRAETNLIKSKESLEKSKKETDNILENVEEGLFLLNSRYEIESQYSKAFENIIGEKKLANHGFLDILKPKVDNETINSAKDFLDIMFTSNIDENSLNDLNPLSNIELVFDGENEFLKNSKFISFRFRRIIVNDKTTELIVTANDLTKQVELSKKLEESRAQSKRQLDWFLNILHIEPQIIQEFIESAQVELKNIIQIIKEGEKENKFNDIIEKVYRSVHLIKGNASLLDLTYFAENAHQCEEVLTKIQKKSKIDANDFKFLKMKLVEMFDAIGEIKLLIKKISQIYNFLRPKRSSENEKLMQSIDAFIQQLSKKYEKNMNFTHDKFDAMSIPHNLKFLIKDILIQLVRNAIFHGVESENERLKKKKKRKATIELESRIDEEKIILVFRDDGRGLQIEKLKEKAEKSGKWKVEEIRKWKDEQVAEIIFEPGITTSENTDLTAGRGIGMDVIKQKLMEVNGEINIESAEGEYCEFRITLPIEKQKELINI